MCITVIFQITNWNYVQDYAIAFCDLIWNILLNWGSYIINIITFMTSVQYSFATSRYRCESKVCHLSPGIQHILSWLCSSSCKIKFTDYTVSSKIKLTKPYFFLHMSDIGTYWLYWCVEAEHWQPLY